MNKEQNLQLRGLLAEKDQHTNAILNAQSTNNELEQQVKYFKRVNSQLETIVHSLEKLQFKRKPESYRSTRENNSQTLDKNDKNLSNTKLLEPVLQNEEKFCHACWSLKHEKKIANPKETYYRSKKKPN